jgi:hypothetical protein
VNILLVVARLGAETAGQRKGGTPSPGQSGDIVMAELGHG